MSSVNGNRPPASNYSADTDEAGPTSGPEVAEQVQELKGVYSNSTPSSFEGLHTSGVANPITQAPPAPSGAKPANYAANLVSAKEKLGGAANASTPNAAAILAAEHNQNSKNARVDADVRSGSSQESGKKQQIAQAQADSIAASAGEKQQNGCKETQPNAAALENKVQALGFSQTEAKGLVRVMATGTDESRNKVAYELAALGMTGVGQANTSALSANPDALKGELAQAGNDIGSKNRFQQAFEGFGNGLTEHIIGGPNKTVDDKLNTSVQFDNTPAASPQPRPTSNAYAAAPEGEGEVRYDSKGKLLPTPSSSAQTDYDQMGNAIMAEAASGARGATATPQAAASSPAEDDHRMFSSFLRPTASAAQGVL